MAIADKARVKNERRTVLALTTGSVSTMIGGYLRAGMDDDFTIPEEDPFPTDVENGKRGGADTVVHKTVEEGREHEDASIECVKEAHDAAKNHLEDELNDLSDIEIGLGRGPEGFGGMAVTVHLTTATYDRDGELVEEADLEFEELVAVTPPTAYVQTGDGERVCGVPIYVDQGQRNID